MKMRVREKRCLAWLLALALCLGMVPGAALAAGTDTLAQWTWTAYPFTAEDTVAEATDQKAGVNATLVYSNASKNDSTTYTASTHSIAVNQWDVGNQYWQIALDATYCTDLAISFKAFGSGTGPKNFKAQISTNGSDFYDVTDGGYALTKNAQTFDFALNSSDPTLSNLDNASTAYIRLLNYDTASIDNKTTAAGGASRLYDIKITGTYKNPNVLSAPSAAVGGAAQEFDGGILVKGDSAPTLSLTAADGATIYYIEGDTDPTQETGTQYTAAIQLDDGANTVKAIAVKDEKVSEVATFSYTVLTKTTPGAAHSGENGTVYAVEGLLTLQSGKSLYLETADGGAVCVYLKDYPNPAPTPGSTILAVGTKEVSNNQPRLKDGVYTVTNTTPAELPCTTATLAEVLDADHNPDLLSRRVKISGLTLGTYDKNNTPVSDGQNSINIYKCPELPTTPHSFDAGTTVNVTAVVGCYTDRQLLVGDAADVEWVADPTAVQDPTADVAGGGNVAPGQTVTFSSATPDAVISYSTDSGATWTDQATTPYTVPAGAAEGNTISIQVKATKAGLTDSDVVTLTYTVKEPVLKDGAKVVIWNPAYNKALSSDFNKDVAVTLDNTTKKLTGFDRTEVWTVKVLGNETYSFSTLDGDQKLSMAASGQSLKLGDSNDVWKVFSVGAESTNYYVENSGRSKYRIEWYAKNSYWSTYSKNYDNQYELQFYSVPDGEIPLPYVATPVITPADPNVTGGTSVEVSITCATEGATIYYTTDGTVPTTSSTPYNNTPFTLTDLTAEGTTVKAIAVKENMRDSDVASKTYKTVSADTDFIQVTDADTLKAGGYFVLVAKDYPTQALSSSFAYKPSAVTVSAPPANGEYAPTLKLAPMDDGVSIQYETTGKYIGWDKNQTKTSFQESDTQYKFDIQPKENGDGTFRLIFSTAGTRAISLQKSGGVFGAYAVSNDDDKGKLDQNGYGPYECDLLIYKSTKGYLYNPHITFGVLNEATVGQNWSTTYAFEDTAKVSELKGYYSLDNTTWHDATLDTAARTLTVPGSAITAGYDKLYLKITGTDTRGEAPNAVVKQMVNTAETAISDLPVITAVSPAQGAETGAGQLKPTFSVTVVNGGEFTAKITIKPKSGAAIEDADMTVAGDTATYTPDHDLAEGWCEVSVTVTRGTGDAAKSVTKSWSCTVGVAHYRNFFGQLHAHTAEYSDGAGTLENALEYVKNTASRNNVQFVAFTDHSNYFDTSSAAAPADALYDTSLLPEDAAAKWKTYKDTVAKFNKDNADSQVAIAGFEMTWSGGPGHINTFNTPGIVSRNNKDLNNKTNDAGMKAYYSLLSNDKGADSISQFNHPGTTFGTFSEFAYYDPVIDSRVTLVEVGNGEGAIGSGGYFPSYSEYIKALDKGWHLAPTNNQDNHKGHWGDSNDARTVVYTTDLSENGIYQAMREMRIYATEDKDLDILYTVNGQKLGSIIREVPASAKFQATITDPDATDKIGKVEIVTNGGAVVHKVENITASSYTLDWTKDAPKAGYYFLRITQADGDIAVTAPVWLGQAKNVGMSELTCSAAVVVKDEAVALSNQFFNNESTAATLKSVTYTLGGAEIGKETFTDVTIPSMNTLDRSFSYTFAAAGKQTVTLTAVVEIGGEEKTLVSSITLDVKDPANMIYVGVDGSHYNEYVSGNYKDSMGNFTTLAADYDVRVVTLNTKEDLLAALGNPKYRMMVFTAPSRRDGTALRDPYANYEDDEIAAIKTFAENGGTLVLSGWGDYYEHYSEFPAAEHMAAQQNNILAAVGSKLRLADDEAKDSVNKPGNNAARLYLTDYNGFKSPLLAGVDPAQVWSQYGGCTLYAVDEAGAPAETLPASVTPMVSGYGRFESDGSGIVLNKIDSSDDDGDGHIPGSADTTAKPPKYVSTPPTYEASLYKDGVVDIPEKTCLLTATEEITHANGKKSLVMVSGGAFMSNFEVKFDLDNVTQLGYSNPVVLGNLLESLDPTPVTDIEDLPAPTVPADETEYVVEGVVTANTSGFDRDTAFFDCTYVQDATGGINVFPVSGNFQVGQRVRVKGIITAFNGEKELTLSTSDYQGGYIKALSYAPDLTEVAPAEVTTKDVAEGKHTGRLVKVQGTVQSFSEDEGAIANILVQDPSGAAVRVFIDGYITADKDAALREIVKQGARIAAVGIASYDESYPDANYYNRIRIRDRADITAVSGPEPTTPTTPASRPAANRTPAGAQVKADDVTEQASEVQVTLNAANPTFSDDVKEKLAELNETKPVTLEGAGLKVYVPAGTIGEGMDPADLLVDPAAKGNAVQVTLADGTTKIVPFALVTEESAAYLADQAGSYTLVDNSKTFADVSQDFWGAEAVDFVSANEIFNGTGGDRFNPQGQMTRAMVVTVLARLSGVEVDDSVSSFPDVPAGEWYTGAVAWAAKAGIVQGDGTNFDPNSPITREALCVILERFTAYRNFTLNEVAAADDFADADAVSDWAQEGVAAALKTGLITGKPGQIIDPAGDASRAEVATVLQRLVKSVLD